MYDLTPVLAGLWFAGCLALVFFVFGPMLGPMEAALLLLPLLALPGVLLAVLDWWIH